jgi:hypothetical protein
MEATGRLQDLLPGPDGKSKRGLSVVEIPMGGSNVPNPPLHRSNPYCISCSQYANRMHSSELASNEEAWQETRDLRGMMPMPFPSDEMVWGTATTQDAVSWIDLNAHGTGMAISVAVGCKYVVVAIPNRKQTPGNPIGDLGSIRGFGKPETESWSPTDACDDLWDHEGVLLGPGDTL